MVILTAFCFLAFLALIKCVQICFTESSTGKQLNLQPPADFLYTSYMIGIASFGSDYYGVPVWNSV